ALDPGLRAPLAWELGAPVPDSKTCGESAEPAAFVADRQKRRDLICQGMKAFKSMGGDEIEDRHESGCDLPEECLYALSDQLPVAMHRLCFTGHYWYDLRDRGVLKDSDLVAAFQSYRQVLQVLTFQSAAARGEKEAAGDNWVLKCPIHIMMIRQLAAVFPDAKLVWAHRHPQPAVSSMCSLVQALGDVFFETNGHEALDMGPTAIASAERSLVQVVSDIQETGLQCEHVLYENLVKDPLGVVRTLYSQLERGSEEEGQEGAARVPSRGLRSGHCGLQPGQVRRLHYEIRHHLQRINNASLIGSVNTVYACSLC
ncbi:sulfotransferase, partial [archaeon]